MHDCHNQASEMHHYNGQMSGVFISGIAEKVPDWMTLKVCQECHEEFERNRDKNDPVSPLLQFFGMMETWGGLITKGTIQFPQNSWD